MPSRPTESFILDRAFAKAMAEQASAESIRRYAIDHFIAPARQKGKTSVRVQVRQVHDGLGLQGAIPLVCEALGAKKFEREAHLKGIKKEGPAQSPTTVFLCEL